VSKPRKEVTKTLNGPVVVPKVGHDSVFEESCAACKHASNKGINVLFLKWTKVARIAELSGLDKEVLVEHFKALGLAEKRSNNTDALISVLMELKMADIKPEDMTTADLINLIKHRDKLNKRIESGSNNDRPTIVVIQALPGRSQLLQTADEASLEKGEIKVLGPGGRERK
jgi:hypothetical protein